MAKIIIATLCSDREDPEIKRFFHRYRCFTVADGETAYRCLIDLAEELADDRGGDRARIEHLESQLADYENFHRQLTQSLSWQLLNKLKYCGDRLFANENVAEGPSRLVFTAC